MDPIEAACNLVSETPSHDQLVDSGGGTLKTGFPLNNPIGNYQGSFSLSQESVGSSENNANMEEQRSFYSPDSESPKVTTSTESNMEENVSDADLMANAGNPAPMTPGSDLARINETRVSESDDHALLDMAQLQSQQQVSIESQEVVTNQENITEDLIGHDSAADTHVLQVVEHQELIDRVQPSDSCPRENDVENLQEVDECEQFESVSGLVKTDYNKPLEANDGLNLQSRFHPKMEYTEEHLAEDDQLNVRSNVENYEGFNSDSQESQATDVYGENVNTAEEDIEEDIVFNFSDDDEHNDLMPPVVAVVPTLELDNESVVYFNDQQCVQLMGILKEQRLQGEFCDLTIKIQNQTYKAHQCILAANGSVLYSMMKDNLSNIIDWTETVNNTEAFEAVLDYLYTGQMRVSMATVSDILAFCRRLGIPDVAQCCILHIEKNINIHSWAHILDLSLNYDFAETAQKVVRFFTENLRHLYKSKEAMYFTQDQLEHILKRCNSRHLNEIELRKLDLAIHWVINEYDSRSLVLPNLLQHINIGLITKEGLEQIYRQTIIKQHPIFEDNTTKMFFADVRESLIARRKAQKLARKPRKAIKPIKISKRGRPHKTVDYSQVDAFMISDDTSGDIPDDDEVDYVPGLPVEPVIVLKKKRGRPPKKKELNPFASKRPRGRPRKDSVHPSKKQKLLFSEAQVKQELMDNNLVNPGEDVTVVIPEDADIKPHTTTIRTMSKSVVRRLAHKVKKKASRVRILPGVDGHECFTCGKKFPLRKQLTRHRIIHREKTKSCDICDYKTTRNDKVRDHIRRVHGEEAVQRGLLSPEQRQQRLEMEANKQRVRTPRKPREKKPVEPLTGDEMISCLKCPRKFPSVSALRHHMKGHGSETPFLCEVCGFSTRHFASINVHKRQHNGKKFRCTFPGCTYENIRKSRLDDHLNAHTGIKNHVCSVCGKSFAGRKHMQRHEKTHCEFKPLKCEHCEYATTRRDKLRDHIRKHHREMAIIMGILDPNKTPEPKEPRPPRVRKPRKKKIKSESEQDRSLLIDESVGQLIDDADSSISANRQETDQATNYVTMSVPPHLVGASTISEDMIQYLASMTPSTSHHHPQLHTSLAIPSGIQQNQQHILSNMPISQAPAVAIPVHGSQQHVMRAPHPQQITDIRGDTWVYHIVPEAHHQY